MPPRAMPRTKLLGARREFVFNPADFGLVPFDELDENSSRVISDMALCCARVSDPAPSGSGRRAVCWC